MIRLSAAMPAIAVALAQPIAAQAPQAEKQYVTEYKRSAKLGADCSSFDREIWLFWDSKEREAKFAKVALACSERLASLNRAAGTADADEGIRHELFKDYVHTLRIHGVNYREKGDPAASLKILETGYAMMMQHFDDGKHFHTLVDHLPLQADVAVTLSELGRASEADTVLTNAREVSDNVYKNRAQPSAKSLLPQAAVASEGLEERLGDYYRDRAASLGTSGKTAEAKAMRTRAMAAYERNETWIRRSSELRVQSMMALDAPLRLTEVRLKIASLQWDNGERAKAYTTSFGAGAYICDVAEDPKQSKSNRYFAKNLCDDATYKTIVASGAHDALIDARVEAQYAQQMDLLKVNAPSPD